MCLHKRDGDHRIANEPNCTKNYLHCDRNEGGIKVCAFLEAFDPDELQCLPENQVRACQEAKGAGWYDSKGGHTSVR